MSGLSAVEMDVIDTLVQENRAFADELEEQILQGQVLEKMLSEAQQMMTQNSQEIQYLQQQLSLKEDILHQAEMEISTMKRRLEESSQGNMRGLVSLGSEREALKQTAQESLQGLEGARDEGRERDGEVEFLRQEVKVLREENSHLQTLYTDAEDGGTLLKESSSQSVISRLQRELYDLQKLHLTDSPSKQEFRRSTPKFCRASQPGGPEGITSGAQSVHGSESSFSGLQQERVHSFPSTTGTAQCPANKLLSGPNSVEDSLSLRSLDGRRKGSGTGDRPSSQALTWPHEYSSLQRHISEVQVLVTELDTYVQDSCQIRLQEDLVTKAVIESLVQQNQVMGKELSLQMMRAKELEELLAEAYEQRDAIMTESKNTVEELQEFISAREQLLKELSGDYGRLKEEKSRLQNLLYKAELGEAVLKQSFHQSQPDINKLQGERHEFKRQQVRASLPELDPMHIDLEDHEDSQTGPDDSTSGTLDLDWNGFTQFLGINQDEQHQNTPVQVGPAAGEATHPRASYMSKTFQV